MNLEIPGGFCLSRIRRSDKSAYLDHFTDPEIAANTLAIPFPYTDANAEAWLDLCETEAADPEKNFAIREPGGYLIGGIGITNPSATFDEAEFGYWLAKSFRGRGIMTRAVEVFADYAFRELKLRRLYATPFVSNIASQRVLEKAGFKNEGPLKMHHEKNGVLLDVVLYGRVSPFAARG